MEKLKKEEWSKEISLLNNTNSKNPVVQAVLSLDLDEALRISRAEWINSLVVPIKTPFGNYILQTLRIQRSGRKFSVRSLPNNAGWLVIRVA